MTTIAVKSGIVAFDSQATADDMIVSNRYPKHKKVEGFNFFFCGVVNDVDKLIAIFFDNDPSEMGIKEGCVNATAYVVTPDGVLYMVGYVDDELVVQDMSHYDGHAIGSGYMYAIGAMDAGCTAREAVKIAAGRDIYTGGRIRTFKVGK